jgi:hypothetical protein
MEMFKSKKSQLTCSYCSRIFKDPIQLPWGDSICRKHLSGRDILKANKIKCNSCKEEFEVENNNFKPNEALNKLIESHSYLSDEEKSVKQKLKESIRQFFILYDEFVQKKTQLESDIFDHFQELRFLVDEHREELNNKFDEIALAKIDKLKKYEEKYLRDLKERFTLFDHSQSFESELNELEGTFRDPDLLVQSIQKLQQNQDESLNDIQLKLNQMNQVKDDLKATNSFQPNKSSFAKKIQEEDTSLFGSLKLDGHWLNVNSFKGQILTDEQQCLELIKLCEFSPNDKWTLLYRATRDGFGSDDFHSRCDGHLNTLTIFKAKESNFIFGGFTKVSWVSSFSYKSDSNAFIFSLTNKENKPLKMEINPVENHHAFIFKKLFLKLSIHIP